MLEGILQLFLLSLQPEDWRRSAQQGPSSPPMLSNVLVKDMANEGQHESVPLMGQIWRSCYFRVGPRKTRAEKTDENRKRVATMENSMKIPQKIKTESSYNLAIPILGIFLRK